MNRSAGTVIVVSVISIRIPDFELPETTLVLSDNRLSNVQRLFHFVADGGFVVLDFLQQVAREYWPSTEFCPKLDEVKRD